MHHVYFWTGVITFWSIVFLSVWFGIAKWYQYWYNNPKLYTYQIYEYLHLKKLVRRMYQNNFQKVNWEGLRVNLAIFNNKKNPHWYRSSKQLFRKQITQLMLDVLEHEPSGQPVDYSWLPKKTK